MLCIAKLFIKTCFLLFKMLSPQECSVLCRITLDAKMAKEFKEKINDEYRVTMTLDNLPLVVPVKRPDTDWIEYEPGFDVGYKVQHVGSKEEKYFIHNHLTFTFKIDLDRLNGIARVVGFEVEPFSVKHEYGKWDDHETELTTCDPRLKRERAIFGFVSPQKVEDKKEIVFTYDVVFQTIDTIPEDLLDMIARRDLTTIPRCPSLKDYVSMWLQSIIVWQTK